MTNHTLFVKHYLILLFFTYYFHADGLPRNMTTHQIGVTHQAHDVNMTLDRRRCDVMTLHRRCYYVIMTSCARWAMPLDVMRIDMTSLILQLCCF